MPKLGQYKQGYGLDGKMTAYTSTLDHAVGRIICLFIILKINKQIWDLARKGQGIINYRNPHNYRNAHLGKN